MNLLALAPSSIPEAQPLEFVEAAGEVGYSAIGLRLHASPGLPFFPIAGNAPLIRELKREIASSGLSVLDVFTFYLQPDTDVSRFSSALNLGAEFGARYALVLGDDPDRHRLSDNFAKMCDLTSEHGLQVALEPAVMRPLATLAQSVDMIEKSGRSDVVLCVDPINFVRAGGKPEDLRAIPSTLLPYVQFNDGYLRADEPNFTKIGTKAVGLNRRCMPGEGQVPLAKILDALPDDILLSVEIPVEEVEGEHTVREWVKITADASRKYLDNYYATRSSRQTPKAN